MTVTPATAATPTAHADAVVVGAGPAGSAVARFLADAGRDVVLLEKHTFPRDKVCGDALTPRAVRALSRLGLVAEAEGTAPGWHRQRGLRMYGGRVTRRADGTTDHEVVLDLPWPELPDWPAHSLTATRWVFDEALARHAEAGGAQLWQGCEVTGPVWLTDSQERIAGVTWRQRDADGAVTASGSVRAPVVVACDGNSSRLGVAVGLHRDQARPLGVAVRAYYDHQRPDLDMMEAFLDVEADGVLLPAYGWIFPLADGTVNVGWGQLDTSSHFRGVSYPKVLDAWVSGFPAEWGLSASTRQGRPASAGLPMSHNRHPAAHKGLLLVGDAAGMVNPFNGEGISYAIEAGALAAEAVDRALATRDDAPLAGYPAAVANEWGGYYRLGVTFAELIGNPTIMRWCRDHGMRSEVLMRLAYRFLAHLVDRRSADSIDRIINTVTRAVPAA